MGETIIEKIIRHNTGKAVKPGDIVTVNVDRCMIHDIFIPFVADKFEEMGFTKLHDPDKVVLIYDHLVPASQQDDTRHFHKGDEFVEKYGLTHVHRSDGICHQLMTEAGYVKPGDIAFGTDSHTTTYGCVGAFSSGIGYTEMASILGTGTMWIKVPETIKVVIDGELPENVMSKDIILRLIGDLRADGATYRALEFSGSTIENMSVASRMTMANMAIEAGAKCALFTPDEKTAEYCEIELNDYQKSLVGDEDAVYMKTMTYKAEDFVPVMACPSQVDKIRDVSELEGTEIDQVFIANTGGQASKASNIGEVCQFAAAGKEISKKSLSEIAMTYGYIYVAQIALGANMNQAVKAIAEAEAYPGPSLIIGYAPCELHGVKGGMTNCQNEMKKAVEAGYWNLFTFNPANKAQGKNPFTLTSKAVDAEKYQALLANETRYSRLTRAFPERAKQLFARNEQVANDRYEHLTRLVELYK